MDSNSEGEYEQSLELLLAAFTVFQPFNPEMIILFVVILLLIGCSSMVSGSEVAFFSLDSKDFNTLKNSPTHRGDLLFSLLSKPRYLLATILIANNLINVAIIILSYFFLESIFDFSHFPLLGFLINVIGITFILVLLGEVIPKVYATQHNLKLSLFMTYPLSVLVKLFKPLSILLVNSTRVIEKRFDANTNGNLSLDDISEAIDIAVEPTTSRQEIKILKGIVKFGNITVKQIMTSRIDMVAMDISFKLPDVIEKVRESGYSRLPVYEDDLDHIIGILHVKDLIPHLDDDEHFNWKELVRQPFFVPETKKIDDLLEEIQINRNHMAIVVDEYGGTSGLVTLEDVLEEVVGEIKDEFDDKIDFNYTKLDDHNYVFDGKTQINDMCKLLSIESETFDEVKEDADSIAGLALELAGRFLKKDESVQYENFKFTVLALDKHRIEKVKVTILD